MLNIPFKRGDRLLLDASVSATPHRGSKVQVVLLPATPPSDAGVRCVLVECTDTCDGVLLLGERAMVAPNRLMTEEDWVTRCQETKRLVALREHRFQDNVATGLILRGLLPEGVRASVSMDDGHLVLNIATTTVQVMREVARALLSLSPEDGICGPFELATEGGGDSDQYLCTLTKGHEGKHWDPAWGTVGPQQTQHL
jgi:hypothetical protein